MKNRLESLAVVGRTLRGRGDIIALSIPGHFLINPTLIDRGPRSSTARVESPVFSSIHPFSLQRTFPSCSEYNDEIIRMKERSTRLSARVKLLSETKEARLSCATREKRPFI